MADLFASLNGSRVMSAHITIPSQGAWAADVVLANSSPIPTGLLSVTIGDLTLKGTSRRMADFAGSRSVRIVGGGGGWRKSLKPKGYGNVTGVYLSSVLNDAARESGETMASFTDRAIGTNWVREQGPAKRTLGFFAPMWWIDPDGKTHIEARASSAIASTFTVNQWSGGKGLFEISTEKLADWMPGRTFTSPTVPNTQRIDSVSITSDNSGKLRLTVLNGTSTGNRLLDDLRAIVRDEIATLTYSGLWEYTLVTGTSSKADLRSNDPRLPDLTSVPLLSGLSGESVTPTPGCTAYVAFVNASPSRPVVVGLKGSPISIGIPTATSPGPGLPVLRADSLALGVFPILPGPTGPTTVLT